MLTGVGEMIRDAYGLGPDAPHVCITHNDVDKAVKKYGVERVLDLAKVRMRGRLTLPAVPPPPLS